MPTLEVVSLQDAQREISLTGKRGVIMRQYMDYIGQLETGQAGKLIPDEDETTAAIRRRLGAAAELLGKNLVVNAWATWSTSGKRAAALLVGEVGAGRPTPSSKYKREPDGC